MKQSRTGNLILEYEEQTKLAILASEFLKTEPKDIEVKNIALDFLSWCGDNLAPDEE